MPWLMKAEPDTRLERGIDVKFSIDDFQEIGISKWDGVRNHEAKKIMKEKMKIGDEVLFYHSNCKVPGVYGLATVHKEGYPDYTAWDSAHPYFDAKSKQDSPTWFMVDVEFKARVNHPVTLALLKTLASASKLPGCVEYIGESGFKAIKEMALVNRGRLSVQPVTQEAYDTILLLGEHGGWEELIAPVKKTTKRKSRDEADGNEAEGPAKRTGRTAKTPKKATADDNLEHAEKPDKKPERRAATRKRKAEEETPRTGDSDSDLSDLPSSNEPDDEGAGHRSKIIVQEPKPSAEVGEAVEFVNPGLRRSTRQR